MLMALRNRVIVLMLNAALKEDILGSLDKSLEADAWALRFVLALPAAFAFLVPAVAIVILIADQFTSMER